MFNSEIFLFGGVFFAGETRADDENFVPLFGEAFSEVMGKNGDAVGHWIIDGGNNSNFHKSIISQFVLYWVYDNCSFQKTVLFRCC